MGAKRQVDVSHHRRERCADLVRYHRHELSLRCIRCFRHLACVAQAIGAHDLLKEQGVSARVLNMHTIKPIDREAIAAAAAEIGRIVTVEEHFVGGGLGGAVAEVLAELGTGRLVRLGLEDEFVMEVADYPDILKLVGLDADSIAATASSLLD